MMQAHHSQALTQLETARTSAPAIFAEVDKIYRPSRELFVREYLKKRRPVIIQGAMDDWPARSLWSQAFFRERYGADKVMVRNFSSRAEESYFETQLGPYIDSFDSANRSNTSRPPYLSDWPCTKFHPELQAHFSIPPYFNNWLDRLPKRARHNLNYLLVLIGPPGAVYDLHVDSMSTHAWIAHFEGKKRFVLYPPEQAENLYRGAVDPDRPDLESYPQFRAASGRREAYLEPGEIIFVPADWWHQVTSVGKTLSIVCNFVNANNLRDLLGSFWPDFGDYAAYFLRMVGVRKPYYIE
jgi:histone arginine demethylase JMJD6